MTIEKQYNSINYFDMKCNLSSGLHEPYIKLNYKFKFINYQRNHSS